MARGVKGEIPPALAPQNVSALAVVAVEPAVHEVEAVCGDALSGGVAGPALRVIPMLMGHRGLHYIIVEPVAGGHVHIKRRVNGIDVVPVRLTAQGPV